MKKRTAVISGILVMTLALPLVAQNKRMEFVERYNARHAKQKPLVGDTLKDVKLFDASGKEFSTRRLRGKHTVLVFGCLT